MEEHKNIVKNLVVILSVFLEVTVLFSADEGYCVRPATQPSATSVASATNKFLCRESGRSLQVVESQNN